MKVSFFGVRGSIPTPGEKAVKYGGNTSCVLVETESSGDFVFDAGTGIRECGNYLLSKGMPVSARVFISHTHWDHIQGFPFFVPSYIPGNKLTIYGPPSDVQKLTIKDIMSMQTNYEYFPIRISQLGAEIKYVDSQEGEVDADDNFKITSCKLNHPVNCFAYKVECDGKTFVYGGDHEEYRNIYRDDENCDLDEDFLSELDENVAAQNQKIIDFCKGADLISWDAQYTDEEYLEKIGWGHSSYGADIRLARAAGLKQIALSHHDPVSFDDKLTDLDEKYRKEGEENGIKVMFAKEGMSVEL
ncbi:MAG: MBL fold metallo-hydrolase [Planctomycetota bacterium]|jgi:ribonuclease BN (tRNA processing enzyme)